MIRKGTYVLFLRFPEGVRTAAGALGDLVLPPGDYCYVGSAMGGLDQRLGRHLSHDKKIRWHIDYLTLLCDDMFAYESEGDRLPECLLAHMMYEIGNRPAADGFGCSDCRCRTHLFAVDLERTVSAAADAGMRPFGNHPFR